MMRREVLLLLSFLLLLTIVEIEGQRRRWSKYQKTRPTADAVCQLDAEAGDCRASHTRWYHDKGTKQCKTFTWGGCGGNENRFWSKEACESKCISRSNATDSSHRWKKSCPKLRCSKRCPHGYMGGDDGCFICACNPNPRAVDCPEQECPGVHCPEGYKEGADGCSTCECLKSCLRPTCAMNCEFGLKVDGDGCEVCQCRETPCATCLMECEYGLKRGDDGCDLCECKTKEEVCGGVACLMECANGFKKDRRGCDLCQCLPATGRDTACRHIRCHNKCVFGHARDSSGCPTCTCNSRRIHHHGSGGGGGGGGCDPGVQCRMHCEHGFKKDEAGCDKCECEAAPVASQLPAAAAAQTNCPTQNCRYTCAFGYQTNAYGCPTCLCRPRSRRPSSPHVEHHRGPQVGQHGGPHMGHHRGTACSDISATCRMHCEGGFAKDANGCDVCRCASTAAGVHPAGRKTSSCSMRACRMYCQHGFVKGSDGCDICKCAEASPAALPAI